jgi:hypothetical protein
MNAICTKCGRSEAGEWLSRLCPCGYMRSVYVLGESDEETTARQGAPLTEAERRDLLRPVLPAWSRPHDGR